MKPILALFGGFTASAAIFAAGATTVIYLTHSEAHRLAPHQNVAALWSATTQSENDERQARLRAQPAGSGGEVVEQTTTVTMAYGAATKALAETKHDTGDEVLQVSTADIEAPAGEDAAEGFDAAHIRDCLKRYRSYRTSDNTFQPYGGGPRRQCR